MNTGTPLNRRGGLILLLCTITATLPLAAASLPSGSQSRNWDVDGLHGELVASGMLVSAPCVLALESRERQIAFGNTVLSTLKNPGDVTAPLTMHIVLEGCPGGVHRLEDQQLLRGGLWLSDQSMVRMRITGDVDPDDSRFFRVHGASGVALRIEDPLGSPLSPSVSGQPLPLNQGRNDLAFSVQLWRTRAPLDAGVWRAVMHIDMEYE
ncbi:fimbrial protein [Klebsiella pneumoniae]|uniref:fimbrial protein n=2 Tax=Klebsiella pneumoniae TaxID=573 RepID=UPI00218104DD|nr:hypothetical protein NUBL17188_39070 [Klebsiella pneumoniae]